MYPRCGTKSRTSSDVYTDSESIRISVSGLAASYTTQDEFQSRTSVDNYITSSADMLLWNCSRSFDQRHLAFFTGRSIENVNASIYKEILYSSSRHLSVNLVVISAGLPRLSIYTRWKVGHISIWKVGIFRALSMPFDKGWWHMSTDLVNVREVMTNSRWV